MKKLLIIALFPFSLFGQISGPISGGTTGGGGSATNVNFYPGQNTAWRKVNGSNVVDVTGTITNPIAGTTITNSGSAQIGGNLNVVGQADFGSGAATIEPDGDVVAQDIIANVLAIVANTNSGGAQIGGNLNVIGQADFGAGAATIEPDGDAVFQDVTANNFSGNGSLLTGITGAQNINARNIKNSDSAAGNGSTDDRGAIAAADAAVTATNGTIYFPPGTYRISSDLTTTNTVWFSSGAKVSVDTGVTWWHRGKLIAPDTQQIFDGDGAVLFQTNYYIGTVYADWFGANSATGVPVDVQLQKAINAFRIKQSEMYQFSASYPSGPRQNIWAHYPQGRTLKLRSGGIYMVTNTLVFQEMWTGEFDMNYSTIYALFSTTTNAVIQCNDIRYFTFRNGTIKTYMGSNVLAAIRFDNITQVESQVTPFDNYLDNIKIYGHQKGFQFGVMVGMGIDNNNERFLFSNCAIMDYERAGVLLNGSQAFDHIFFNCTFSGGGYGWFGVTAFDPTWAPSGSGSFHVIGGGGGANIIADFCANSFRQTAVKLWDSESSRRLYVDPFFPVPTNSFSFDTGGTNFFGTNTLVAGFAINNTNWIQVSYTNDYTAHANKDVWEYLVSTGGVQRIAVTAGTRPYNPTYATEGVTTFNIVRVGPSGITNYDKTWGSLGNASTRTQPVTFRDFNFSSDIIPWDGTAVLVGSPRPFTFQGRWRTLTNHVKFGMFTSTTSGDDSAIDFHGSTFNVESAATSPPTDAERVMVFRSDGTLDTNGVNGNFVSIIGGNNIHASVPENVTSNLLGNTFQRSVYELAGTGSKLIVGGTVISNAVASFTGKVGIGTNTPSVPLEIFKASPSANEILLRLSTSDDASRFSVDEDGDVALDGSLSSGGAGTFGASSFIGYSSRSITRSPANGVFNFLNWQENLLMSNTNGLLYVTGSLVISSNSWTNVITLNPGDRREVSSNGIPFVIAMDAAGTLSTNPVGGTVTGSGNGAWRTNALTGVAEPNLSPYDPETATIVIPQDAHFLASNGVSSRIFYPNGNAFAEFPLDSGFEFNEPGGQTTIKVASSAAGGYSLINTNNDEAIGWEDVAGVRMPLATTTTMVVTNLVSPFGQLLSTGNATNYTIDFNTSDKQSITATGNVAFLTINNISNGAMKRFYITNVFWGTSNINVLMPTNCLVVTTNSGGPAAIGGGGSTNWVMTVTNDAKLSIECHGTSMRTLVWYLRLLQP